MSGPETKIMPGGITDVPISKENSLVIEELGRYAVDEYNKKANALLEFSSVVRAKQQIVAGTMYYLTIEAVLGDKKKLYLAKVWVKPWMNFKELQDFKPLLDSETETTLGGITNIPISNENSIMIEELGRYAVDEYNKKANALLEFSSVLSAKEQIVAGAMYYLTIEAVLGDKKKLYLAKVWVKPWMNFKELQDFKPLLDSETETILGGITNVPISNENSIVIEELGRYAVDEYNKKANALLEFSSVVSAREQIVAGTMYYLTIEAVLGDKKKLYLAKVWVKPWMNFKKLQDFKPLLDSETKTILGGTTNVPISNENNIVIEELGRYAVDEYNKKANALLEFSSVVSAREQIVAGTMYYLTIEAVLGDKKKLYLAKVWIKPWMNFKELQDFKPLLDSETETILGGITNVQISNENSIVIEELGRYAVDEYNKKANALLEFSSVVSAKEQIIAGAMYYLTIEAIKDGKKKLYQAKVGVKPWMNFKELEDFKPLLDSEPADTSTATA